MILNALALTLKRQWNLTDQGKLYTTNRPLYDRLKAEADGVAARAEGNPWRRETWSLTEQGRVFRANPARAEILRAEAEAAA